jgi:hypothetical protein
VRTKGLSFDEIRQFALTLPETEVGTAWGSPMLRVNGRIFAGIPVHKSAEPNSFMVQIDVADRDALIEEQPDVYYTAAHYENYPCVLVRLSRIRRDALEDLVRMAHRYVSTRHPKRRSATRQPRRAPRRASPGRERHK